MRFVEDVSTLRPPQLDYFVGLDLGKVKDYTALAILERHGAGKDAVFHARHLQRYALGTPYPAIVVAVAALLDRAPFKGRRPKLAVDETGVGAPVVDLFRDAKLKARLEPVHITAGSSVNYDNGVNYVPKRDLVSVVQVALQTERLKIAGSLPEADTLVREMQNFQVRITEAANDTYGAWRENTNDDLVLAVALALWLGMRPSGKLIYW